MDPLSLSLRPTPQVQIVFILCGAIGLGGAACISFWKSLKIITRDTDNETEDDQTDRDNESNQIANAAYALSFSSLIVVAPISSGVAHTSLF
jgi:hypothetical protein